MHSPHSYKNKKFRRKMAAQQLTKIYIFGNGFFHRVPSIYILRIYAWYTHTPAAEGVEGVLGDVLPHQHSSSSIVQRRKKNKHLVQYTARINNGSWLSVDLPPLHHASCSGATFPPGGIEENVCTRQRGARGETELRPRGAAEGVQYNVG